MSQKDFIWGTATAAYQIEGAWNINGKSANIWDVFCQKPGHIKNGDSGAVACDHYHRTQEDINLIHALGVDAYRMSLSWTRLLPNGTGAVNQKGVDFYHRLFDDLLENNITPWVTLYHWDLPQILQDNGGWTNRDIVDQFSEYAELVAYQYGDKIKNFIILNEPSITSYLGHYLGVFAPGIKSKDAMYASTHHQNLVNGTVTSMYRELIKEVYIGSSFTYFPFYPKTEKDRGAELILDRIWNRNHLNPIILGEYQKDTLAGIAPYLKDGDMNVIRQKQDFIGINHYAPSYVIYDQENDLGASLASGPSNEKTDIGWDVSPTDFKKALIELKDVYQNPVIYITENGMCENSTPQTDGTINDARRISYLERYIGEVETAKSEGCNIQGYFLWSLMDNFEWAEGYQMRFGIIFIDYEKNLDRVPKKSYYWYQSKIRNYKDLEVCDNAKLSSSNGY
jgi:beta-glucosidase